MRLILQSFSNFKWLTNSLCAQAGKGGIATMTDITRITSPEGICGLPSSVSSVLLFIEHVDESFSRTRFSQANDLTSSKYDFYEGRSANPKRTIVHPQQTDYSISIIRNYRRRVIQVPRYPKQDTTDMANQFPKSFGLLLFPSSKFLTWLGPLKH